MMFDIRSYDHPEAAERAASFVRAGLLFSKFGGDTDWPVDLDVLPAVIAAEKVGADVPDADRAYAVVLKCQCPIDRAFFDMVFAACDDYRDYVSFAMEDIANFGMPSVGDRETAAIRALRCEPLAIMAAAVVCDAVAYATGEGRDRPSGPFILQGSTICAEMMPNTAVAPSTAPARNGL